MDFLDYQKTLGINFDSEQKKELFIKRIEVFIKASYDIPFEENDEKEFAYMIGASFLLMDENGVLNIMENTPTGLQRAWLYLSANVKSFRKFLSCLVALVNTYSGKQKYKKEIIENIKRSLNDCHILFEIVKDDDGIFIFPKGAKELDDALVSEPLAWLSDYPNSRSVFVKALREYSEQTDENASDIADKFRKALETFFQEFFGGEKSLENYKSEYGNYLKSKGVPAEISNNFQSLLDSYTKYINNYAKHHDKTNRNVLEYIMYQTGNIIRLLINLNGDDKN